MPNYQLKFDKVNVVAPFDALAPDEVATAQNVDFSIAAGGLSARRGCTVYGTVVAGTAITQIFRNYNQPNNIAANPFYVIASNGTAYRGTGNSWTAIASGLSGAVGINAFNTYAMIGAAGVTVKDDGTNVTDWIKQTPGPPTVTINTLGPLDVTGGTGTWSVTDGTLVSGTTTTTFSTDANDNASVLMTLAGPINLDSNGAHQIGAMGIFFLNMAFSDPTIVSRVSQDYSVGDATFQNYWHAEITPQNGIVVPINADPTVLVNAQLSYGTNTGSALTIDQKAEMISQIRDQTQPALSGLSQLAGTMSPWGVGQTEFGFVGTYNGTNTSPWRNIYAVRINVQCTSTATITVATPTINGAMNYPLNDISVGYTWWQTFAALDTNGNKYSEGAPSQPVGPFQVQEAQAKVVSSASATGGSTNGINAIITYRQGGYAQTPYAVNTTSVAAGAISTFTDSMNDVASISQDFPLVTNIQPQGNYNFANMVTIAEPFLSRVFYGENNNLHWSLPGQIDSFPNTSYVQVGYIGDNIRALSAWPTGLVIINQNSVYEFTGGNLEAGQWQLNRSAAQKGSISPNVCVKTPYGIPLLSYDGLSMYQPGQGVSEEIAWLRQEWGDLFYGGAANSPGGIKYAPGFEGVPGSNRARPINYGHILGACAAYGQGKLYLAVPTGVNTINDTVYVLDFVNKKVNMYSYISATQGIGFSALYWDYQNNNLVAGTTDGRILSLESGQVDIDTTGASHDVVFTAVTQQWTVPNDTVLENVSCLVQTEDSITLTAIMDGLPVSTTTLTSTSSTTGGATRSWVHVPLNGTFCNSLAFYIVGSQGATSAMDGFYQLNFDLIPEPTKVVYYRAPYDDKDYEPDKKWDVAYYDIDIIGTGTITAVTFVDSTAVMTQSLISTGSTGRRVYEYAFPAEIYGRVAYTTYTGTNTWTQTLTSGSATTTTTGTATVSPTTYTNVGPNYFKLWRTYYDARNEPPKINYWRTDIQSLEENICDAFDVDLNVGTSGSCTATCFVDNVAVTTYTITGTASRQSYTITLPEEQYGRTIFVVYTGNQFKQYKTWFHLRQEPDRWTSFVTAKYSGPEHEYKVFRPELNCLGGTVLCTATVDGTAVATYTATGSTRQNYTFSLPAQTFGRTVWASYASIGTNSVSGALVPFKHYWNEPRTLQASSQFYEGSVEFVGDLEPDRVTIWRTGPTAYPSSNYLKTWNAYIDPLNGTVTGTLTVDDVAIATCTFTGNKRQWFTVGLDLDPTNAIETGSRWEALYNSMGTGDFLGKFKHYDTKMETEVKPFGKDRWAYSYRKIGGASQVDLARFWSFEMECDELDAPLQVVYYWDIDNATNFVVGTITLTGGVQWTDRISFPPGGRSRMFLFRCTSNGTGGAAYGAGTPFKVYKVNIDLDQEGIKGLVRRETPGTPAGKGQE